MAEWWLQRRLEQILVELVPVLDVVQLIRSYQMFGREHEWLRAGFSMALHCQYADWVTRRAVIKVLRKVPRLLHIGFFDPGLIHIHSLDALCNEKMNIHCLASGRELNDRDPDCTRPKTPALGDDLIGAGAKALPVFHDAMRESWGCWLGAGRLARARWVTRYPSSCGCEDCVFDDDFVVECCEFTGNVGLKHRLEWQRDEAKR